MRRCTHRLGSGCSEPICNLFVVSCPNVFFCKHLWIEYQSRAKKENKCLVLTPGHGVNSTNSQSRMKHERTKLRCLVLILESVGKWKLRMLQHFFWTFVLQGPICCRLALINGHAWFIFAHLIVERSGLSAYNYTRLFRSIDEDWCFGRWCWNYESDLCSWRLRLAVHILEGLVYF